MKPLSSSLEAEPKNINAGVEAANKEDEPNESLLKFGGKLVRIPQILSGPAPLSEIMNQWCARLLEDPENGFEPARQTVNIVLNPNNGEVCPSQVQVKAAMMRTLTEDQLNELERLREPTLLIVPHTIPERLISAVDHRKCRTMRDQRNAYFDEQRFYRNALLAIAAQQGLPSDQPMITKYRFAITEGAQHFAAESSDYDFAWNQNNKMESQDRIAAFEAYLAAHPGLVSQNAAVFMMRMIHGLLRREPTGRINQKKSQATLLPGEPNTNHVRDRRVVCGSWNDVTRQAVFKSSHLVEDKNEFNRLCTAVMGEIT